MIRFATPRLIVRDTEETDFPAILSFYTCQEAMRYISDGRYDWTLAELKTKYSRCNSSEPGGPCLLTVEVKETGEIAGEAGLFDSYDTPSIRELGYILAPGLWGKGYGTELCRGLIAYGFALPRTEKIVARMYAANEASVRLCEKMQMSRIETGTTGTGHSFYTYELTKEAYARIHEADKPSSSPAPPPPAYTKNE